MHCRHRTCPGEEGQVEKACKALMSKTVVLMFPLQIRGPLKGRSFIFSQAKSSGSTRGVSLSFLLSVGQLLYQVRFRVAKFGAKNGEELEKGVPASQCLGRRWWLRAEVSILYHKETILGTAKHPLQRHMWKGCYSGHAKTASLSPVKHPCEAGGAALHWGWGAAHVTSKPLEGISPLGQAHVPWVKPTRGRCLRRLPLSRRRQTFLPGMQGMRCPLTLRKRNIHFAGRQTLGHHLVLAGSCQLKC